MNRSVAAVPTPLAAQGLTLRLGRYVAVNNFSVDLRAGEWAAIVGPNGAGKSTLLQLLAGLRQADQGEVRLAGQPLMQWPARERAQRLAWLAQQGEAEGDIAARDVVCLGRLPHQGLLGSHTAADEAAVQRAMADTECAAFAARRLHELSGGERQRVLLARALAVEAPVMLLDEPTTHLDAPHQRALLRAMAARARDGAAIAVVLHDLSLALCAPRVLVMDQGQLIADGAPADAPLRAALVAVFGGAFSIQSVLSAQGPRWVAVPTM
jgi:iron complex transport system ATP-binding protein